jgi:hypothetical protein
VRKLICEQCGNPPNTVQVTGMERGVITRIGMCCPCDSLHDINPTDLSFSKAISQEELAWAAGFFDGEGHVGCHKHGSSKQQTYYRMSLSIAQSDRRVLDRFQKAVDCGVVRGPYKHGKNRIDYFMFNCQAKNDVHQIYNLLRPYLSIVKSLQFMNTFQQFNEYRLGAHERHVSAGVKASDVRWHEGGGIEEYA